MSAAAMMCVILSIGRQFWHHLFIMSGVSMLSKAVRYIVHWEEWHWFVKYILISPAWFWLCLRARSFWFFTSSNPGITFGGFVGETKREIYKQLPPSSYPKSIFISPGIPFSTVQDLVKNAQLSFPFVTKPDVGQMGFMFRKIDSPDQLRQYHEVMGVDYIIQELVKFPVEVSVFYYRYPNESKGHITGFLKKGYLEVVGDGKSDLRELISRCPRAQFRLKEMFSKHQSKLETILPAGARFQLTHALNLSRGGRLINLEHEKDERLREVFDEISRYTDNFYYGRYDIRCASIEDLKDGKNFSILEYNGCGAEPHHIYHNGNSLIKACRILVEHWNILYEISTHNYRLGARRWNYFEGLRYQREATLHLKKLKELDCRFEFKDGAPTTSANVVEEIAPSYQVWLETDNTKFA